MGCFKAAHFMVFFMPGKICYKAHATYHLLSHYYLDLKWFLY